MDLIQIGTQSGGGGLHHTYCFGAQVSERLVPTALDFTTFSWLPLLGLGM